MEQGERQGRKRWRSKGLRQRGGERKDGGGEDENINNPCLTLGAGLIWRQVFYSGFSQVLHTCAAIRPARTACLACLFPISSLFPQWPMLVPSPKSAYCPQIMASTSISYNPSLARLYSARVKGQSFKAKNP